MTNFKKGDAVTWNTPQGKTKGKVTSKITTKDSIAGHQIVASKDEPQYEVTSDASGKKAAHKPESLHKQ